MNRTKWMRLAVRDLGDVIRWAGAQNAREIGELRYRVVNGREMVSFRLVPRYAIDVGAREIIVLAYARVIGWRARLRDLRRIAGAAVQRARRKLGIAPLIPGSSGIMWAHRCSIRLDRPFIVHPRFGPAS